ncbi:hypothetical protein MACK_000292 [Theileria orientalis]|uniref:Uncharacterized protein n=1 Tax=Theileria orientalis TaxID=68886 RepID=A0A976M9P7_THEOR|nr:hypothetical protein MACK_000292 [Theileria orientalis]
MSPCPSNSGVCNLNPEIIREASDKEKCLKTLFGFFSTVACDDSKPKEYIYSGKDGITTIYVSKDISKLLWKSCSKRAELSISDMIEEDESKRFCKNLTLAKSKVKIRQSINLPGLNKIPIMRSEDIAEIDWLLGGHVNWNLIKLKISGVLVLVIIVFLTLSTIYVRQADVKRRLREPINYFEESDDNLVELDLNI